MVMMPGFSTKWKMGLGEERFFDWSEIHEDSRIYAMLIGEIHVPTQQANSLVDN
jgi:hypothetical protein